MEKVILNSLLKSTKKPYNPHLWLNILSAHPEKKKVLKTEYDKTLKKQTTHYIEVDDYIIKYILVYETGNGEKIKNEEFVYNAYLSEFAKKEESLIRQMIKLKTPAQKTTVKTIEEIID